MTKPLCLLAAFTLLAGCSWVELEDEAQQVVLGAPQDITECQQLSHVTASVMKGMGPFSRSQNKISQELSTIARNEAARLGGDTVVPSSSITDGRQHFTVYQCQRLP